MTASSREYFAEVAGQWDDLRRGYFSESVREKAIALVHPRAGMLVADVGAGTGFLSEALLNHGLSVIAVDESQEMLEAATRKLGSRAGIEFRAGPAEKIPIENEKVDCVFANMLLHHVDEPRSVMKEIARILKPGGKVAVTDLDEHDSLFLRTEHHDKWMGFKRNTVRSWLEQAGLDEVGVIGLDENCCATSSSGAEAEVSIFAAVATKPIHKTIK